MPTLWKGVKICAAFLDRFLTSLIATGTAVVAVSADADAVADADAGGGKYTSKSSNC